MRHKQVLKNYKFDQIFICWKKGNYLNFVFTSNMYFFNFKIWSTVTIMLTSTTGRLLNRIKCINDMFDEFNT